MDMTAISPVDCTNTPVGNPNLPVGSTNEAVDTRNLPVDPPDYPVGDTNEAVGRANDGVVGRTGPLLAKQELSAKSISDFSQNLFSIVRTTCFR